MSLQAATTGRGATAFVLAAQDRVAANVDDSTGFATVAGSSPDRIRTYVCDRLNHCIDVLDHAYEPIFGFGGRGSQPGQFETPADVAVVWLDPADAAAGALNTALVLVADCGNDRIQAFEMDGVLVGTIEGTTGTASPAPWPPRSGWPYFRLATSLPRFSRPKRLAWRAPYLEVVCAEGTVRFELAPALLPEFDQWLDRAADAQLAEAMNHFMADPTHAEIPDACLLSILGRRHPIHRALAEIQWRDCA